MSNGTDSGLHWLDACQWLEEQGQAYCIATVIAEVGSVPRASGSKMVISMDKQFDTLGGGSLEYQVIEKARKGLKNREQQIDIESFSLSEEVKQCCGGAMQILFEYRNIQLPKVVIFGAGHVCQALCSIVKELPCFVTVIDSRSDWLDKLKKRGIQTLLQSDPIAVIPSLSSDSYLVVMTQNHELDFDIIYHALERCCFPFIGLIGSQSKKQNFELRLNELLSDKRLLKQLTCPIGYPDIKGKLPMQIAVSIAAQLMDYFSKAQSQNISSANEQCAENWEKVNQLRKDLEEKNRSKS